MATVFLLLVHIDIEHLPVAADLCGFPVKRSFASRVTSVTRDVRREAHWDAEAEGGSVCQKQVALGLV